jgi:hypothetical protein
MITYQQSIAEAEASRKEAAGNRNATAALIIWASVMLLFAVATQNFSGEIATSYVPPSIY